MEVSSVSELKTNEVLSFKPVLNSDKEINKILRPSTNFYRDSWERFKRNKLGIIGLVVILLMVIFCIVAPMLSKFNFRFQDLNLIYNSPNATNWMGTDNLGRDLFVRVAYGARISLACGLFASLVSLFIGVLYGTISAYFGGIVDDLLMRFVDIFSSIPSLLYVILLMTVFKANLINVFVVIGLTGWMGMARLVRGEILSLKQREFVLAAKVSNVSSMKIMLKHLIPNAMGPIIVSLTLSIPSAIFLESSLSFLGVGISAPMPSWGGLASEGIDAMRTYPHLLFFPAVFISVTILAFHLVGDALRDALDPRMK